MKSSHIQLMHYYQKLKPVQPGPGATSKKEKSDLLYNALNI